MKTAAALLLALLTTPALGAWAGEPPPAEAFFATPTFRSPELSPNGENIAFLMYKDGVTFVIVKALVGNEARSIGKFADPAYLPSKLIWANDDRLLISGEARSDTAVGVRARETHLYGVDRDGENLRWMAKKWPRVEYIQYQDEILHTLPDDPKHVLIQVWIPGEPWPSVHAMMLKTGRLKRRVTHERHIYSWQADRHGVVRVGWGVDPPNYKVVARSGPDDDFETIAEYHATDETGLDVLGFTKDPDLLLVGTYRPHDADPSGDRVSVWTYSISKREFGELVFAHPRVDVEATVIYDPATREPVALRYFVDAPELHFLDEEYAALQRGLDKALPDRTNSIIDTTRDGQTLLVRSSAGHIAPEFYLVVRKTGRAVKLFSAHPDLEGYTLARMEPISYAARDGLTIHGYLTRPVGSKAKALPAVLLVHGGPWARDILDYDPEVQFLASRGYAVLQVNYRGSTGFGSAHESAGYQRYGLEMQDDLSDAAAWLVKEGIADPKRIGIYGGSYGGYASVMAAVKTPGLFRAAASYAGVFDWQAELRHDSRYAGGRIAKEYLGDSKDQLREASPIHFADRVQIPILLAHGEDDPNVHVNQSKKMAKALRKAGKDVELVIYRDEIHGTRVDGTSVDLARRLEGFFAEHLKPGTSATAPTH